MPIKLIDMLPKAAILSVDKKYALKAIKYRTVLLVKESIGWQVI